MAVAGLVFDPECPTRELKRLECPEVICTSTPEDIMGDNEVGEIWKAVYGSAAVDEFHQSLINHIIALIRKLVSERAERSGVLESDAAADFGIDPDELEPFAD
jgi:hypothetical protein